MTFHSYESPIKRVAVIGGGPSGVPAARHLREAGLEVVIYEHQSQVGGVWNYKEDASTLVVPSPPPVTGAFVPATFDNGITEMDTSTPCYLNLTNNVPTRTMGFKDFEFPKDTPDSISHRELALYIQHYWKRFSLESCTRLNTRVETATKDANGWELTLREKIPGSAHRFYRETFDAVLVATGHYNAPRIPHVDGLASWSKRWSGTILHSKGYRKPEDYTGKHVLVIGAGTSGVDIANDLSTHVGRLVISSKIDTGAPVGYQTFRNTQRKRGPSSAVQVSEVKSFQPLSDGASARDGKIELVDGTILTDIDTIIFCTGYQYSFPFLPHLHQSPRQVPGPDSLVIEGDYVSNLYRDVFFIPDPTLAFVGISVNTSAFSFFEYQSISVARVFSGKARLPNQVSQRNSLDQLVKRKGPGKFRHFMGQKGERQYVRETVAWINQEAAELSAPRIEGHSAEWLWHSDQAVRKAAVRLGLDLATFDPSVFGDLSGDKDNIIDDRESPSSIDHYEGSSRARIHYSRGVLA